MSRLLWIFSVLFLTGYLFTASWATEPPKESEIDALLAKVSKNINNASQATAMAKEVSQKMAEEKAKEKEQLKQAVTAAEAKVEKMEKVQEMYAAKMIANGIDTTIEEIKLTGPAYDAYLNYVEEGGKEEFEYFRVYLWGQKVLNDTASSFKQKPKVSRPGVVSKKKNSSLKTSKNYTKKYRSQGRK